LALATQRLSVEALRRACSTLLQEHERPLAEDGTPSELPELMATVEGVRGSPLWARAMASSRRLVEAPFALPGSLLWDLEGSDGGSTSAEPLPDVLEGVVDLAFREDDGWVVVDYKTDVGDARTAPERLAGYRRQVDLYARCWEHLTGESVKERILFFTRSGTEDRW
jgi:ATP-dependent helicase/nuclease subunit A